MDGLIEGCSLGMPDLDGPEDGSELGSDDGIDVGQSDTEGPVDGCLLGSLEVASLGLLLGFAGTSIEGRDVDDGSKED